VTAKDAPAVALEETRLVRWRLMCGDDWTVPVVELSRGSPQATVVLCTTESREILVEAAEAELSKGNRVLIPDLWYFGECRLPGNAYQQALLLQLVGERPIGVQASQLAAVARWGRQQFDDQPVSVQAHSDRTALSVLIAAALEPTTIQSCELPTSAVSLKQVISDNRKFEEAPEQFTFGLLREFDIPQLEALASEVKRR
jgi:hypothetical protein